METNINSKELTAYFLEQGFKLDFDIIPKNKTVSEVDKSFEDDLYKNI